MPAARNLEASCFIQRHPLVRLKNTRIAGRDNLPSVERGVVGGGGGGGGLGGTSMGVPESSSGKNPMLFREVKKRSSNWRCLHAGNTHADQIAVMDLAKLAGDRTTGGPEAPNSKTGRYGSCHRSNFRRSVRVQFWYAVGTRIGGAGITGVVQPMAQRLHPENLLSVGCSPNVKVAHFPTLCRGVYVGVPETLRSGTLSVGRC